MKGIYSSISGTYRDIPKEPTSEIQKGTFFGSSMKSKDNIFIFGGEPRVQVENPNLPLRLRSNIEAKGFLKVFEREAPEKPSIGFEEETGAQDLISGLGQSSKLYRKIEEPSNDIQMLIGTSIKSLAPKVVKSTKTGLLYPSVVTRESRGEYYGLGTYERTEETSGSKFGNIPRLQPLFVNNVKVESGLITSPSLGMIETSKENERPKLNERVFGLIAPSFRQNQNENQKQRERQRYGNSFGDLIGGSSRYDEPTKPKIKPPFGFVLSNEDESQSTFGFIPEAKVKGKWIQLSKPVSRSRALSIGSSFVDTSLSRSFSIVPTNLKVKQESFGVSLGKFRPSKRNPSIFVERPRYSLERTGEIGLIQRARKSKSSMSLGIFSGR
jgi:hypothetical protein